MADPRRAEPTGTRYRLARGVLYAGLGVVTVLGLPVITLPGAGAAGEPSALAPAPGTGPALDHPMRATSEPVTAGPPPVAEGATSPQGASAQDLAVAASSAGDVALRSASAERLEPFVALGFSWLAGAEGGGTGRVRVHRPGGWSEWQDLAGEAVAGAEGDDTSRTHADAAATPTAAGGGPARTTSEPIWARDADGWQAELPASWREVEVHLVRPTAETLSDIPDLGTPDRSASAATLGTAESLGVAGVGVDPPAIHGRAEWGARAPRATPWVTRGVRGAIVHHSVTAVVYQPAEVPAILRSIQAFHQDANGWTDIGYNFAVDRFGRVWEGRAGGVNQAVLGAHTGGFNFGTVGVVVLGDFSAAQPTAEALAGLEDVLAWKLFLDHTDPALPTTLLARDGTPAGFDIFNIPSIVGHQDLNSTSCPGTIEGYLPAIRAAVAARVAGARGSGTNHDERAGPVAPEGATPLVGDFDGDGSSDVYWFGHGRGDQVWYGGSGGLEAGAAPGPVPGGYLPAVGDYDGDGRADIYWHDPTLAVDAFWYGRPGRAFEARPMPTVARTTPFVGDFDGNGTDDVLLYGGTNHDDFLMQMFRGERGSLWVDVPDDIVPVVGDFDGDTRDDILLHHPWGGVDEAWFGADDAIFTRRIVPSPQSDGTRRPLVGDVDADHAEDIVWLDGPAAGTVEYGRTFAQGLASLGDARLAALADVTGGGTADLVTAGGGGGAHVALAGTDRSLQVAPVDAPAAGHLLVGDFGPDGRTDLVWAQPGEPSTVWLMR